MYPDSSVVKNRIALATSAVVPALPIGILLFSLTAASSGIASVIAVLINPGATAFTVTPLPASSLAKLFVIPMIPAFAAA